MLPEKLEAETIINEGLAVLPRELIQFTREIGHALGKVLRGDGLLLEHLPRGEVSHAQAGPAVETRALVKVAVEVDEALGERPRIVRIRADDAVMADGTFRRRQGGQDHEGKPEFQDASILARLGHVGFEELLRLADVCGHGLGGEVAAAHGTLHGGGPAGPSPVAGEKEIRHLGDG